MSELKEAYKKISFTEEEIRKIVRDEIKLMATEFVEGFRKVVNEALLQIYEQST